MKKINVAFLLLFGILAACGGSQTSNSEQTTETPESGANGIEYKSEEIKDCDEFLDRYEDWVDDYLALMDKYMASPMDMELAQEFMTLGQEATDWVMQWSEDSYPCVAQEKYQKRFDEISEKADKKMEELGF